MALGSYLQELRAKPEIIRRRIAFWTSFGITLVILAFWAATLSPFGSSSKAAVERAVSRAGSPGQSLAASVGAFFVDIKDIVFGPRKVKYESVEVRPAD